MKKASIMTLILVLTATLFAGCRNTGTNTTGSTAPVGSTSTTSTVMPMPDVTLPTEPSITTTPGGVTDPATGGMTGRAASRPSARGPRY